MHSPATSVETRVIPAGPAALTEAGALLRAGRLVAFPTETVYGLGANALEHDAAAEIFAVKQRPRLNPLIVHVLDRNEAAELVVFNALAANLADSFWPGGLTLVLPQRKPSPLAQVVGAGLGTAAVRSPANPVARTLLAAAGIPLAAPSANRAGRISPTTAAHVLEELGGSIPLILDGGPCAVGLESTIVGFSAERPILLRSGAVPRETIEAKVGPLGEPDGGRLQAPGMMTSHYAPRTRLRLGAARAEPGEALLAFGPHTPVDGVPSLNLSPAGDLTEAAANLFAMLRRLDATGVEAIAVMDIPNTGLGEAINDRLARAAAPRDG